MCSTEIFIDDAENYLCDSENSICASENPISAWEKLKTVRVSLNTIYVILKKRKKEKGCTHSSENSIRDSENYVHVSVNSNCAAEECISLLLLFSSSENSMCGAENSIWAVQNCMSSSADVTCSAE